MKRYTISGIEFKSKEQVMAQLLSRNAKGMNVLFEGETLVCTSNEKLTELEMNDLFKTAFNNKVDLQEEMNNATSMQEELDVLKKMLGIK